jgi:hypothetical protein
MPHPVDQYTKPRTIPELAAALREIDIEVSPATLYRLIRSGELPCTEVGGRKRSTIAAFLAATTPQAQTA